MKKIFASILALAAFASCSTAVDNDFVAAGTTFTAPMEISVAESRAFDADLNWSWETTDVIAAYQNAGEKSVNALTLNASGNFYNEAFTYATEELSQFHFVYPASQLGADYSLTVAQTGAWTPVLYGTVEAATVANLGTVEMNYLSSAFEVRVWENGRAARKNIVKAVLSSANDFVPTWNVNNDLTYTQTLSGKELSLELNGDTAIFNLGEGDFAFNLVLTDTEGETLTYELPAKNFVAGKRTILNVEWRQTTPAVNVSLEGVNSWYEEVYNGNTGSTLDGGCIYINGLSAEGGEPTVYVDGVAATVVDGKVAVTSGTHTVYAAIGDVKSAEFSVTVCQKPVLTYTVYSSYNSNDGSVSKNNNYDGRTIYAKNFAISEPFLSSAVTSVAFVYGGTSQSTSIAGSVQKSGLGLGSYDCYATATIAINGNIVNLKTTSANIAVTGIPYTMNVTANDGWNAWSEEGNVKWNNGDRGTSLRLGNAVGSNFNTGASHVTKTLYVPADTRVIAKSAGEVHGSKFIVSISTTYNFYVGGSSAGSQTASNNAYASFNISKSMTLPASNPTIQHHNSNSTNTACTYITSSSIFYE